jgi:hypothetical protein
MAVDLKPYDYPQVLRSVFEVDDNCLRVKVVSGGGGGGGGDLEVLIDHTEDSVRLGDGTKFLTSTNALGKVALDVNVINSNLNVADLVARDTLEDILDKLNTGTILVSDSTVHTLLTTIISKLISIDDGIPAALGQTTSANSMPVTIASDQTPLSVNASLVDEPIKISGTENGQPNGPEFPFVNNVLQQILKAKDRTGTISYDDFGNKNQRITQITYTAPSIGTGPGFTAVKNFTYTLIGNRYRRDTPGDWSLV